MTTNELIQELKQYPANTKVYIDLPNQLNEIPLTKLHKDYQLFSYDKAKETIRILL